MAAAILAGEPIGSACKKPSHQNAMAYRLWSGILGVVERAGLSAGSLFFRIMMPLEQAAKQVPDAAKQVFAYLHAQGQGVMTYSVHVFFCLLTSHAYGVDFFQTPAVMRCERGFGRRGSWSPCLNAQQESRQFCLAAGAVFRWRWRRIGCHHHLPG